MKLQFSTIAVCMHFFMFKCESALILVFESCLNVSYYIFHTTCRYKQTLKRNLIFMFPSPSPKGKGHIAFGADPVGVGVNVSVSVTLSCLHDIS